MLCTELTNLHLESVNWSSNRPQCLSWLMGRSVLGSHLGKSTHQEKGFLRPNIQQNPYYFTVLDSQPRWCPRQYAWTLRVYKHENKYKQPIFVYIIYTGRKEMFYKKALNTFYLWVYGVRHIAKDHSVKEETCCCHYPFWSAARYLLYMHREDSMYIPWPLLHQLWSTGWSRYIKWMRRTAGRICWFLI